MDFVEEEVHKLDPLNIIIVGDLNLCLNHALNRNSTHSHTQARVRSRSASRVAETHGCLETTESVFKTVLIQERWVCIPLRLLVDVVASVQL